MSNRLYFSLSLILVQSHFLTFRNLVTKLKEVLDGTILIIRTHYLFYVMIPYAMNLARFYGDPASEVDALALCHIEP